MSQKKPFVLAPHRPMAAKPTPPSPFRLILRPDGGAERTIECLRNVQDISAALRKAKQYAGDVGLSGTIDVQERAGNAWAVRRIATVKNSAVTGWQVV